MTPNDARFCILEAFLVGNISGIIITIIIVIHCMHQTLKGMKQ